MNFEMEGRLVMKCPVSQVSPTFRKREFVIEHSERSGDREFTDYIRFQVTQDRCDILDRFKVGQEIKVSFSLRGRKYEKDGDVKYFTNIEAWKIEDKSQAGAAAPAPPEDYDLPPAGAEDDLPF
ncbi:MAG TPA: DUF3127 domain-containing protein [Bacteroidales bacterium]|nr:DUF3127 domain-containing protein [Bacteroidales bacterium]